MHLAPARGVPQEERDKAALDCLTDRDAARVFIEVARRGSLRSAAERLEFSIDSVRRRIDDFQIGTTLLRDWQENDTFLVASAIRYLAFLPSRQWPHPAGAAHDRLAGGSLQSREIPVV